VIRRRVRHFRPLRASQELVDERLIARAGGAGQHEDDVVGELSQRPQQQVGSLAPMDEAEQRDDAGPLEPERPAGGLRIGEGLRFLDEVVDHSDRRPGDRGFESRGLLRMAHEELALAGDEAP
jgi:hypothetical protein